MENTQNIFLVGFMGSGKTTLGKNLANKLNKTFIDLDVEIEVQEKKNIMELFSIHGEDYFRNREHEVLIKIINENQNFVMSLGGGTPCFYDNMDIINQSGVSVYLKYNAGILTSRLLKSTLERPLVVGKSENELSLYVNNKLSERELYYLKSKIIVEGDNLKIEELINLIQ